MPTHQVLNTYLADYRVILGRRHHVALGEIAYAGAVSSISPQSLVPSAAGAADLSAWSGSTSAEDTWRWHQSIEMVHELTEAQVPLTFGGPSTMQLSWPRPGCDH